MNARMLMAALIGVSGIMLAGNTRAPAQEADSGEFIFQRDCSWCHGNRGQGSAIAPPLTNVGEAGASFMVSTGRMPLDDAGQPLRRKPPSYSSVEIASIASYVATLGDGPSIPELRPRRADPGRGARLYATNCGACHSSTGIGAALTSGEVAPGLHDSTARQVAEAVRVGPGTMPAFPVDVLDDDALNDLVAYIEALRFPNRRGGFDLGRVGPVTEGFVAWAVGLLALLLFIRSIGEKR